MKKSKKKVAKKTANKESGAESEGWKELVGLKPKERFWEILRELTEYDERTKRHLIIENQAGHYARKAVLYAEESSLRIYIRSMSDHVYDIIALVDAEETRMATAWTCEDGIPVERAAAKNPGGSIHSKDCLTDILSDNMKPIKDMLSVLTEAEMRLSESFAASHTEDEKAVKKKARKKVAEKKAKKKSRGHYLKNQKR